MTFQASPLRAAVARNIHRAARPAAEHAVGVHFRLPHPGKQHARIMWIHGQTRASGIRVGEQDTLPVFSTVGGAKYAALLLWPGETAQRTRENHIRIGGVNHDPADAPGCIQPHVRPGFAGVDGFINSVSGHVGVPDGPCFARAGPHHFVIGRSHRQRSDGGHGLVVENRNPGCSSVGGFPNAAGRSPYVISGWIARNARGSRNAVPDGRPHRAEPKILLHPRLAILRADHRAQQQSH